MRTTIVICLWLAATPLWAQSSPAQSAARTLEPRAQGAEFRIGADDLLAITVLQAPELNVSARVSGTGEISLPLIGVVRVLGRSTREVEQQIEDRLRAKYIREPDVSVQVSEMQSHAVSVVGAVRRPGIFQIRGSRTLLEVLSLAEGLADDAGESVLIQRSRDTGAAAEAGPATFEVKIKTLMDSDDSSLDVAIHPGDVVKVQRAAVVYVVGEVKKPGAFAIRGNAKLTVLSALAMGEGLTPTAAKGDAVILRTNERGERTEIALSLDRILKSKESDVSMEPQDVLFVPGSVGKAAARLTIDALARIVTLRGVIP